MLPCKALKMDNCSTEKCCIMRYLHGLQPLDNLHKDGSVEKVTVSRFYDNQNNPQGFIIVATDITELSNMKKELLIGEEIYKLALKQANTTLWQYDVLNHTIEQLFCPDEVALGILDINKTYYNIPEYLLFSSTKSVISLPIPIDLTARPCSSKIVEHFRLIQRSSPSPRFIFNSIEVSGLPFSISWHNFLTRKPSS